MEMLLTVGLIIFSCTTWWCVVYILRKTFERGSKLKRSRNVVKKISTVVSNFLFSFLQFS